MFNMINRDHVTGAVFGVAILSALSFMTGCSEDAASDKDTAVTETETTEETTEEGTETTPEDTGDTDPTGDTGTDTGTDTGMSTES
jgi:hypothetical protein